jgi:hypothetical protein
MAKELTTGYSDRSAEEHVVIGNCGILFVQGHNVQIFNS